ncbi:MAG: hypothetical protein CM1200mP9_04060 [Gammaproteobacteria bacterium]|nr:MAG: hypothetical protein CM1200mP9_04060 [Gammaproteobacteria bacterium]
MAMRGLVPWLRRTTGRRDTSVFLFLFRIRPLFVELANVCTRNKRLAAGACHDDNSDVFSPSKWLTISLWLATSRGTVRCDGRIIECHPADSIGYLGSHPSVFNSSIIRVLWLGMLVAATRALD